MRALIVGGGLMGLSIARALAERTTAEIVVLERSALASGGTGKSSGVIRSHYGVPSLAAMAWHSLAHFESNADELGFHQVGYLVGVGAANADSLRRNVEMHQQLGIEVERVSADRAGELWPHLNLDDFGSFAYEPRAGYGDASQTALDFGRRARAHGATIKQRTPVAAIRSTGDRITGVCLQDGTILDADVVVIAAGPWSRALLAPLDVDFPVRAERAELLIVDAGRPQHGLPVLSDLVSLQYIRPEGRAQLLVGNSDHSHPVYADPDHYSNRAHDSSIERAGVKIMHRLPHLAELAVTTSYAGCYDVTPDYNPVIAAVGPRGLYLAAGFSGHGFKISPAVGDLTADLVLDGGSRRSDVRAEDFRLTRFAEGQLLRSPHPYVGAGEMR